MGASTNDTASPQHDDDRTSAEARRCLEHLATLDYDLRRLLKLAVSNARRERVPYKPEPYGPTTTKKPPSAGARAPGGLRPYGLTARQAQVLDLWCAGCCANASVAAALFISVATAKHHATKVFAALGVSGKAEAVAAVMRVNGSQEPLPAALEGRSVDHA